jgi:hypothetical protein
MTHQPETGGQRAAASQPITYHGASGYDWDIVKAQARYQELAGRDLYSRAAGR